jgi:hypothetical protein
VAFLTSGKAEKPSFHMNGPLRLFKYNSPLINSWAGNALILLAIFYGRVMPFEPEALSKEGFL